jgi:MoxR-like ATPase
MPSQLLRLKENVSRVVIGKREVLDLMLVGLIARGHILIEDVPGVGKTLMARAIAASCHLGFRRLQCTPDLMPTDVTGFFTYDKKDGEFVFRPGPVMTNILLVDEINRAVPRTQSSLLESMEERQATVDGQTFPLPSPFMVMATQNPIEMEGTFPLPEAQLDRFLLKVDMGYPTAEEEEEIILAHGKESALSGLESVVAEEDILFWQKEATEVFVHPSLRAYMIGLVRASREHPAVELGASPRGSLALFKSAKALAFIRGRAYVIPDDVKHLAPFVLSHRLLLHREERYRGNTGGDVVDEILSQVPVPVEDGWE